MLFRSSNRAPGFSRLELAQIQRIWAGVAADYAPWQINVTTRRPSAADLVRSNADDTRYGTRVVITPRDVMQPNCRCASGRAEMDLFSVWGAANRYRSIAWVFSDYGWNDPSIIAALVSHEVGHEKELDGGNGHGHPGW